MIGTQRVVKIGLKVIQLTRQNLFLKYGSGILQEYNVRRTSKQVDEERCLQARINVQQYRFYSEKRKWKISEQNLKLFKQIGAGNCMEMTTAAYVILRNVIPAGVKIELISLKNPPKNYEHTYIAIKPAHADSDKHTLIGDPWPLNQLTSPQVVKKSQYIHEKEQTQTETSYTKPSNSNRIFKDYYDIKYDDFDHEKLQQFEKDFSNKQYICNDPQWRLLMQNKVNFSYKGMLKKQNFQIYNVFKGRMRTFPSVRKPTK